MIHRRPVTGVAVVVAALATGTVLAATKQAIHFTTIYQGDFGGTAKASHKVIEDAQSYSDFFQGQPPSTPSVDFSKEVVLAVSLGAQPTGGYTIEIPRIDKTATGGAVVRYVESGPGVLDMVPQVITQPMHVVKVKRGPTHFTFKQTDAGVPDVKYSASVMPMHGAVVTGHPLKLDVQVFDPSGSQVKSFTPLHTQDMHMIIVSEDLEDFQHVHPQLQSSGDLTTSDVNLTLAQPYAVFLEYQPANRKKEEVSATQLVPQGAQSLGAPTLSYAHAFYGTNPKSTVVGQTSVELNMAPHAKKSINARVKTYLMLRVRDQNGGAANIQDWLGMPGHAIALSPDLSSFFHIHAERGGMSASSTTGSTTTSTPGPGSSMPGMPSSGHPMGGVHAMPGMGGSPSSSGGMSGMPGMGGSSSGTSSSSSSGSMTGMPGMGGSSSAGTSSGSSMSGMTMDIPAKYLGPDSDDLTFDITLPEPGLYKVFFQFQRAGKVITAPFVVNVDP